MGRAFCWKCHRSKKFCFCPEIVKLNSESRWIILSHPKEAKRKTSTGRMTHLMLKNSFFINTDDVDNNLEFSKLISCSDYKTYLLFPDVKAVNLSSEFSDDFRKNHKVQFVIIDATWYQAKKMLQKSQNLSQLTKMSFISRMTSNFKIRTQPRKECLSSIECAYEVLSQFENNDQPYSELIAIFDRMVSKQIDAQLANNPNHIRKWELKSED